MNKEEMYIIENIKCEEFKKRLVPITNWDEVEKYTQIFHTSDNNIYNDNIFIEFDKKNNLVSYRGNNNYDSYTMSSTGWYYYDEYIADIISDLYTPKLFIVYSVKYPEDYWFTVAFDEGNLVKTFKEEMRENDLTEEEFYEKYTWEQLKEVNGFKINLE